MNSTDIIDVHVNLDRLVWIVEFSGRRYVAMTFNVVDDNLDVGEHPDGSAVEAALLELRENSKLFKALLSNARKGSVISIVGEPGPLEDFRVVDNDFRWR